MGHSWSEAARSVWGKSSGYDGEAWMPLVQHLEDSAAVGSLVWDWLPARTKRTIEDALPPDARDGKVLLTWLAGSHDVAKCSPPFASKVPPLADRMCERGLVEPLDVTDFGKAPHGLVGHVVLGRWLEDRYEASWKTATTYAVIVGGHHGVPPTIAKLDWLEDRPHLVGRGRWHEVQWEILDEMAAWTGADRHLSAWARCPLPTTAQAILTGAVIVSDWLASNTDLFPFDATDGDQRAGLAWDALRLPPPWHPQAPPDDVSAHLLQRFPRLRDAQVRPMQRLVVEAIRGCSSPPLVVIESGMGTGKTEAALLAAETLAQRFDCGGVFVGLPTMATSDGMFARVLEWVEHLDGHGATSAYLAHGKAGLNDDFRGLIERSRAVDVHDEEAGRTADAKVEAQVLAWLTGRKKGVLANMVVGTIDQLLFMALQAKHAALRHLAFAGKVVVIDEVHAADDFMRMFLVRVLEWLAAYGVPVLLLSATLPSAQRQELADAYRRGLGLPAEPLPDDLAYPLVTTVTADGTAARGAGAQATTHSVDVRVIDDNLDTLTGLLGGWLVEGGCVAVIRNTVGRAQKTAAHLRECFGDVVVLHHSRFIATHRASREALLRVELGPDADHRPARRIVVGTQVLEQSLDVDFDAMVTDLAPVDLVLQRIGRLHRHPRGAGEAERPPRLRTPQVVLTGIDEWDASGVPTPGRASRAVYGLSRLYRSAGVLSLSPNGRTVIALPSEIRTLIEGAYATVPPVPESWREAADRADATYRAELAEARIRADIFRMRGVRELEGSLVGWLQDSSTEAEDGRSQGSARVRDSDDGIEVVVTQRIGGEVRFIADESPHAGRHIPTALSPPDPGLARALAATTVRLPMSMTASPQAFDATLAALEANAYEGWQQSPWLVGQLVLHLDESWRATVGNFALHYDLDQGLTSVREDRP
ncbi:CRISPR-associated helicase Cas3' [Nocardioides immobilis]|uniref:CRISPR-associated helicase Cas3 n=1 Tax=Nocardioides immobilis TaxID=2049295 RepID=A0A417XZR2_9ACTN|nr:CRISPR-associated helicase Cas3' [Nocardioides immobilis]RHW25834.1 CRISPR-associated helicase Cas3' [Nocardioides immobilis]